MERTRNPQTKLVKPQTRSLAHEENEQEELESVEDAAAPVPRGGPWRQALAGTNAYDSDDWL